MNDEHHRPIENPLLVKVSTTNVKENSDLSIVNRVEIQVSPPIAITTRQAMAETQRQITNFERIVDVTVKDKMV